MRLHNRQVKASFWTDGTMRRWPILKCFLYQGLWQLADDSGCLEYDLVEIKGLLAPTRDEYSCEALETLISEFIRDKKLVAYRAGGKRCLYLVNFHKHQRLSNPGSPEVPLPKWVTFVPSDNPRRGGQYLIHKPYGTDNTASVVNDSLTKKDNCSIKNKSGVFSDTNTTVLGNNTENAENHAQYESQLCDRAVTELSQSRHSPRARAHLEPCTLNLEPEIEIEIEPKTRTRVPDTVTLPESELPQPAPETEAGGDDKKSGKARHKGKAGYDRRIPEGHIIYNDAPTHIANVPDDYLDYLAAHADNLKLGRMVRAEKRRRQQDGASPPDLASESAAGQASSLDGCIVRMIEINSWQGFTPAAIRMEVFRLAEVTTETALPVNGKLQALIVRAVQSLREAGT